ncbi:MAG TPA: DUF6599 family protein [Pyrinomonadaceae bacterium]|nr:DUF6599 family protein [Pyrinomonadaceae bacterium]
MLYSLRKLFYTFALVALVVVQATVAAVAADDAAARLLSERFGDFVAAGAASAPDLSGAGLKQEDFEISTAAMRLYQTGAGEQLSVTVFQTSSNGAAYSLLTREAKGRGARVGAQGLEGAGRAAFSSPGTLGFVKGSAFVIVSATPKGSVAEDQISALARAVEQSIDAKPGEFPVLVQHLPDWEQAQASADYAVSLPVLQKIVGTTHTALDAVSFEGGTEAVAARYGDAQLVIIEFTTPQYAADNDARINERINQLRQAGQPIPSFYKREGNYSVFVFDAADESTAAALASNVKYEKEVRWLGDNPHAQARAEERYTNTMGNVILTTLKTTGLAILLCLSIGGLFGGIIFLRRRAQATAREAYSDAGGMLRLNLEDAHVGGDTATRLVGKREM